MADVAPPELRKRIEESITKVVPVILASSYLREVLPLHKSLQSRTAIYVPRANRQTRRTRALSVGVNASSQQIKILCSNSSELLDLKAQPLAKPLTEEKWKDLSASNLQSRAYHEKLA